jgi:hypothetical protein
MLCSDTLRVALAHLIEVIGSFLIGAGEAGGASPRLVRLVSWVILVLVILAIAWAISLLV